MLNKTILALILASVVLVSGCSQIVESSDKKAPDFKLEATSGRVVRLSHYENRVVILNFFATWCPPCRHEIPDFIELVNEYRYKDFALIGISLDNAPVEQIRDFVKEQNINYPVLLDDGTVSQAYGPISSIPTTFIIDKNRNIAQKIIGARSKEEFEKMIKPLL